MWLVYTLNQRALYKCWTTTPSSFNLSKLWRIMVCYKQKKKREFKKCYWFSLRFPISLTHFFPSYLLYCRWRGTRWRKPYRKKCTHQTHPIFRFPQSKQTFKSISFSSPSSHSPPPPPSSQSFFSLSPTKIHLTVHKIISNSLFGTQKGIIDLVGQKVSEFSLPESKTSPSPFIFLFSISFASSFFFIF